MSTPPSSQASDSQGDTVSQNWLSQKWSALTSRCSSLYSTAKTNDLAPYIAWTIAKPALVAASDYLGGPTLRDTAIGLATATDLGWAVSRLGSEPSYAMAMNVPVSVGMAAAAATTALGTMVAGSMGCDVVKSYAVLSGLTSVLGVGGAVGMMGGLVRR